MPASPSWWSSHIYRILSPKSRIIISDDTFLSLDVIHDHRSRQTAWAVRHTRFPGPALPLASLRIRTIHHGDLTAWIYVRADIPIDPPVEAAYQPTPQELFRGEEVRMLLVQCSKTFQTFLPITPAQWEVDLRNSPCADTLLQLWQTVLGVFGYYVGEKKLPPGAATDYFWIIIDFCNGGAEAALRERHLRSLKPDRVRRVVEEIERYFARPCPAGVPRKKARPT